MRPGRCPPRRPGRPPVVRWRYTTIYILFMADSLFDYRASYRKLSYLNLSAPDCPCIIFIQFITEWNWTNDERNGTRSHNKEVVNGRLRPRYATHDVESQLIRNSAVTLILFYLRSGIRIMRHRAIIKSMVSYIQNRMYITYRYAARGRPRQL